MTEEKGEYITKQEVDDAMEMMGAGYAVEIHPPQRVIAGGKDGLTEYKTRAWIKLSTSFRAVMSDLKGSRLSVFLCICLHIDEDNNCYPGLETIAKETGYSRREVWNAVEELTSMGLLQVKKGAKKSNLYHVTAGVAMGAENAPVHFTTPTGAFLSTESPQNTRQNAPKEELRINKKTGPTVHFATWDIQHGITPSVEGIEAVKSAELYTTIGNRLSEGFRLGEFPQSLKAQQVYRWIAKKEESGQKLDAFIGWVMQDERRREYAYIYHKDPELIKRDWPRVFPKNANPQGGSFYG